MSRIEKIIPIIIFSIIILNLLAYIFIFENIFNFVDNYTINFDKIFKHFDFIEKK